jgi:glutamine synthetase
VRILNDYNNVREIIEKQNIKFVDFKIVDLIGRWRHVTIPSSKFTPNLVEKGIGFDGSNYGYTPIQKSDLLFIPDITTTKVEQFSEDRSISMTGDIYEVGKEGEIKPFSLDPRRTAKRAVEYLNKVGIADHCYLSPEFEFYIFDRSRFGYTHNKGFFEIESTESFWNSGEDEGLGYKLMPKISYHAPKPGDKFAELRNEITLYLEEQGISVKYHHHEIGSAGESEVEVGFTNLVEAADNTLFIKYAVKNIAYQRGKSATFMPKPLYQQPGNGLHLHTFLMKDKENIFHGSRYGGLSKTALYYIGGLLKHGASLMAFTNPSTNSYKRLFSGFEAPINFAFALANRSAAIRIPGYVKEPSQKRIELRVADATCNPYLAYSAMLMAGLDGIENDIDPEMEGFGPYEEDIYELQEKERIKIKNAPKSLEEALIKLREDHDYLLKDGVFTKDQINNWIKTKMGEVKEFYDKPHPYEYLLYYDI